MQPLQIIGDTPILIRQAIEIALLMDFSVTLASAETFDNFEGWPIEIVDSVHPVADMPTFFALGDPGDRLQAIRGSTQHLVNLIHPTASISRSADLSRNIMIGPQCVVGPAASIGDGVLQNALGSIEHDNQIGAGAFFGTGAILCGHVTIGEGAFVGGGATIQPQRRVGAGATVGTGSVVVRDVAPGLTVVGNPARPIK